MPRRRRPRQTTSPGSSQPERSTEKECLEHFERFCYALKLPDTLAPFRLEEWQLDPLRDYFEHGALEHLWMWPTGMGKSTLLGALCLHHATYVRVNPRVIILGGLGGHAKHTFRAASWFITQSPTLSKWWVAQEYGMGRIKSLIREDSFGVINVSSAGRRAGGRAGTSQEGEAPSLVVVEELHRHEDNGAAVRTLTTKVQKRTLGKHRVRIVHVTTAGDSHDSFLGRMENRALSPDSHVRREGYYTRAEDAEGDLVMHKFAVPDEIELPGADASPQDISAFLDHVKLANPASFIVKDNLRRSWKASASEPWVFARQHCNQWVAQSSTAFSRYNWAQGAHKGLQIPPGAEPVYVGLDTATSWASTAIIPVWPTNGRMVTAGGVILSSKTSSTSAQKRRMRDVIDVIEVMRHRWPALKVVFDRNYGGGLIAEQFEEDHGIEVIDHGQGVPMEHSSMLLGELIAQHMIDHDDNDEVTAQVLAAEARTVRFGKRWRLEMPASKDPIDAAVALAMACWVAYQEAAVPVDLDDWRITELG